MPQRLRKRGLRVPEDMSIVGCDDIFGADFCNPPLTTLSSPIEQAGRVAVSVLLAQLNPLAGGRKPQPLGHAHAPHSQGFHCIGTHLIGCSVAALSSLQKGTHGATDAYFRSFQGSP